MELQSAEKTIEVPDLVNEKILYRFTEKQFLDFLYQEKRCSTNVIEGRHFQNLVFCAGRRSGKSSISAAIADYEFYKLLKKVNPSRYYNQAPGETSNECDFLVGWGGWAVLQLNKQIELCRKTFICDFGGWVSFLVF